MDYCQCLLEFIPRWTDRHAGHFLNVYSIIPRCSLIYWVHTLTQQHDIHKKCQSCHFDNLGRLPVDLSSSHFTDSSRFCNHHWRLVWLLMLCFSCNITVPFPFSHFIPLIPLSALDVGEAPAPASPPTLSLHYSLHTIILLPPTWRHGSPSFVSFYITCFNMLPVCLFHHMSKSVAISHFYCQT